MSESKVTDDILPSAQRAGMGTGNMAASWLYAHEKQVPPPLAIRTSARDAAPL